MMLVLIKCHMDSAKHYISTVYIVTNKFISNELLNSHFCDWSGHVIGLVQTK